MWRMGSNSSFNVWCVPHSWLGRHYQDTEHCTRGQTQGRLPMTNSTQGLNPCQLTYAVVHSNSGSVLDCARASDRHDTGYCRKAGMRCNVEHISPRRLKFNLAADNAPVMSPEDGRRGLLICYFHIFECTSHSVTALWVLHKVTPRQT